jgi:hypothetical protein
LEEFERDRETLKEVLNMKENKKLRGKNLKNESPVGEREKRKRRR